MEATDRNINIDRLHLQAEFRKLYPLWTPEYAPTYCTTKILTVGR